MSLPHITFDSFLFEKHAVFTMFSEIYNAVNRIERKLDFVLESISNSGNDKQKTIDLSNESTVSIVESRDLKSKPGTWGIPPNIESGIPGIRGPIGMFENGSIVAAMKMSENDKNNALEDVDDSASASD